MNAFAAASATSMSCATGVFDCDFESVSIEIKATGAALFPGIDSLCASTGLEVTWIPMGLTPELPLLLFSFRSEAFS